MLPSKLNPRHFAYQLPALLMLASFVSALTAAEPRVDSTSHGLLGDQPLHVYTGSVALPADGLWTVHEPGDALGIGELYLVPSQPARLRQLGDRMYAALEERQVRYGRWQVQAGFHACREFAHKHDGVGPGSIDDFADDERWDYAATRWRSPPRQIDELENFVDGQSLDGPFIHLIPRVRFEFVDPQQSTSGSPAAGGDDPAMLALGRRIVPAGDRAVLAFELRPFIDDGKHWVLFTDGSSERVEIDLELVKQQQVKIRPIVSRSKARQSAQEPNLSYRVVAVARERLSQSLSLNVYNVVLEQSQAIQWDLSAVKESPQAELHEHLVAARRFSWKPYLQASGGGVLSVWDSTGQLNSTTLDPRRRASLFSVLGGRAAIDETLQLQDLTVTKVADKATIDIGSLAGVQVNSHPFEEMLGGDPGESLEMALYVPADRFFLYVGKPESIPALLDSGAPFLANMGTTLTGNCLNYNLQARYLARLGMSRDWIDAVLASGLTSEMALFTPDLFFIDGTDVTVVAKLRQPQLLQQLLALLGAADLTSKSVLELPTVTGEPAFLALRDDLLLASTSRDELEQSIGLLENQGEGSLGASAEFRYMLTQLNVSDSTRLYAYFSDPFVRRLVGPRVKLGQLRRVLAKAKMEALTAEAMLARLDGYPASDSQGESTASQPLPKAWQGQGMSVDARGLVSSQHYGTLPHMRTLPDVPLDQVTPEEAEAYRLYVENYSRYWRRFFDPIAIRLDEVGSDQLELSTFILPLVDNSIYNGLRSMLSHQDDGVTLDVPVVQPQPVVQFSANLSEQAWQQVAGNFSEFFTRYSGASAAMLDDFGPGLHVAIFDADPIIAIGSGDIFGSFGGQMLSGGGDGMLMIPVALSMLTRPCSIMVETQSPERTSQYLRQAALAGVGRDRRSREFDVSFYQVDDRDEWVWTLDIFGVVKLRYGIEVVDKYLVIRNIPWSSDDKVVSSTPALLNAAMLQASPSACRAQLPGLFAAASDANRRATMSGLGRLYPFMLAGAENVDQAATEHQRLFGFYPKEIAGDRWSWNDYRMLSQNFGQPTQQRQPAFDPQQPFGLMNRIDSLQLNMQFEQDGLRSSVRWRLR